MSCWEKCSKHKWEAILTGCEEKLVSLEVRETSEGISKEELDSLFSRGTLKIAAACFGWNDGNRISGASLCAVQQLQPTIQYVDAVCISIAQNNVMIAHSLGKLRKQETCILIRLLGSRCLV